MTENEKSKCHLIIHSAAAARGAAYAALKRVILRQPAKYLAKECVKIIPFLGQAISAGLSVALTEAAGWQLAQEFALEHSCRQTLA